MPFKIYFYGNLKLIKHYLHPSFGAIDVCDEITHTVTTRWYQFAWLGITINIVREIKNGSTKPLFFFSFESITDKVKGLLK